MQKTSMYLFIFTSLLPVAILSILSTYSRALSCRPVCHRNILPKYSAISPHDCRSCLSLVSSSWTASLSTSLAFLCAWISAMVAHNSTSGFSLITSSSLIASEALSVNHIIHNNSDNFQNTCFLIVAIVCSSYCAQFIFVMNTVISSYSRHPRDHST